MDKNRNARWLALEILCRVDNDKAHTSALLPGYEAGLNQSDGALLHEIVLGVLRNRQYLDCLIGVLSTKKGQKFDIEVLNVLRIGLYQILFLTRVPVSAAANESVKLVQAAKKTSAKGMVNAILRRAALEKIDPLAGITDEMERVSVKTSHPIWLIQKWVKDFGKDAAFKIAEANNTMSRTSFRVTNKADESIIADLRSSGLEVNRSGIAENAWWVKRSSPFLRQLSEAGKIYFQDEASQLVAEIVSLSVGNKFLDVCAAPGSKTTLIADKQPDAEIFAGDRHRHRLRTLRAAILKHQIKNTKLICYDAEKGLPFTDESFDTILVDAPCSGTGTIQHNPEIRWHLRPSDLVELPVKQLVILENVTKCLKSGGRLIYSTCSLEKEENEDVIDEFLKTNPGYQKVTPKLPEKFATSEGFARTIPYRDGCDGFFIAELQKL